MSKPKFHIAIKNDSSSSTLELHFLDFIYDGFDWNTYTEISMVSDTIEKVKAAKPTKIKLLIDSQGGDAGIGLAIYNFLTSYDAKVETDIVGMAGSIASVIAMAANKGKLKMARNSFMVIHKAWGVGVGNSDELRAAADVIDKYTAQVVDVYVQRTGKTGDEVNALIANGDYWMTGEEAVSMGFADEIYNDNSQFQIAARVKDLAPNYKNIPQNLVENNTTKEVVEDTPKNLFTSFKNEIMKIVNDVKKAFADLKAVPANVENTNTQLVEGIENALTPIFEAIENRIGTIETTNNVEQLQTLQTANDTLTNELNDTKDTVKKLQDDIANLIGGGANPPKNEKDGPTPIGAFVK